MMPEPGLLAAGAALLAVLLVAAGLLAAAEAAVEAVSRAKLHALEERGNRRARRAGALVDARDANSGALALAAALLRLLAAALAVGAAAIAGGIEAAGWAGLSVVVLLPALTEVLPRAIARSRPERTLLALMPLVRASLLPFAPLHAMLAGLAVRLAGHPAARRGEEDPEDARRELRGAVDELHREGAVVGEDRYRLDALLDLHELEVSDVMVHRTNMRSINADTPAETLVREILQSPHTRLPMWRGSLDNIVGVLHAKDLLRAIDDVGGDYSRIDLMKIARKPWFVPDTTRLQDQLNAFLKRKSHFAIVVDEYGEVEGLVTLEDILEEIVGEIADEHDVDMQGVRQEADGSVVVDGSVPIRDLNRALGWNLPDEEATTIAGLVIHETQSIPEEKQAFTFHGKRFLVMKREKNRITRIRIRPAETGAAERAAPVQRSDTP
jgi:Mg2+/Co2+ transporter CorB